MFYINWFVYGQVDVKLGRHTLNVFVLYGFVAQKNIEN